MKGLRDRFHPTFEALSAYADEREADAARTRVGRHVERCAACRDTVGEIRALGDAARASELPGAPATLWAGIARAARAVPVERPAGVATFVEGAPSSGASDTNAGAAPRARGTGATPWIAGGALVAAVVLLGVLANGSRRNLRAAAPARLTVEREYAVPGARVAMTYRPAPTLAHLDAVTVWAWYSSGPGAVGAWPFADSLKRAGTLRRVSPQEFAGSITFPAGTQVASYVVGDSLGNVLDRANSAPRFQASVLAADSAGHPTFDALVTFLGGLQRRVDAGAMSRAGEQLERNYPSEPETWLLTYSVKRRGLVGDFVKLFESDERVYERWHDKLKARPGLSVTTEATMAQMGSDLIDSARAVFWTERLIKEHPMYPGVVSKWIARFSDVPADSIPLVLAAFEPIWQRGGWWATRDALVLAERSGDTELMRRWRLRDLAVNPFLALGSGQLEDASSLNALEQVLRERLAQEKRDSLGAPTVWSTARMAAYLGFQRRQRIRSHLAAIQLTRGDARGARAALDSVVRFAEESWPWPCPLPETLRWRAEAARRLGDMGTAREDLAYVATVENWRLMMVGDSAATLLGTAYSPDSWERAKREARERHRRCFAAARAARAAER
jgi:hypothetical protein